MIRQDIDYLIMFHLQTCKSCIPLNSLNNGKLADCLAAGASFLPATIQNDQGPPKPRVEPWESGWAPDAPKRSQELSKTNNVSPKCHLEIHLSSDAEVGARRIQRHILMLEEGIRMLQVTILEPPLRTLLRPKVEPEKQ